MKFIVSGTRLIYKQLSKLDERARRIVEAKIELLELNPYRFKPLHGHGIKLFRIRLTIRLKEARLVYAVIEPDVVLLCFIDRDKDYREPRKVIRDLRRQLKERTLE